MRTLYTRFKRITSNEEICKTFEELAFEYQRTRSPRVFAAAYIKGFGCITKECGKTNFDHLLDEDKASIIMYQLDCCLSKFTTGTKSSVDVGRKGAEQFLTVFLYQLKNHLIHESWQATGVKKKGAGTKLESYDALLEANHFRGFEFEDDDVEEGYLGGITLPDNLTKNEWMYCWAMLKGIFDLDTANTEIANYLGVSCTMVGYIKKGLKEKLRPVFFPA